MSEETEKTTLKGQGDRAAMEAAMEADMEAVFGPTTLSMKAAQFVYLRTLASTKGAVHITNGTLAFGPDRRLTRTPTPEESQAAEEQARPVADEALFAFYEAQPSTQQIREVKEEFGTDTETAKIFLAFVEGLRVGRESGLAALGLKEWPVRDPDEKTLAVAILSLTPAPAPRVGKHTGPLPQPTFEEIKAAGIALTDGPFKIKWAPPTGELALIHSDDKERFAVKLIGAVLPWWGFPEEEQGLWNVLEKTGIPALLLLFETVARLLELPPDRSRVTVSLDELGKALGPEPRSRQARLERREQVYRILLILENLEVHGCRNRPYHDPETKEVLELRSQDPLIKITSKDIPQGTLDGSGIPLVVTFTYGDWMDQFRGNRQVLTDLGDFRRLTQIPNGKSAGALAQRVGLALNQKWRERAARGEIRRVGEDMDTGAKHPTFPATFTRQELCELYRGELDLPAILDSPNPRRAIEYWDDAIDLLKKASIIGHYKTLDPQIDPELKSLRSGKGGWQDSWYEEARLDIRPNRETTEAIREINTAAKAARKTRTRKKKVPQKTTQNC